MLGFSLAISGALMLAMTVFLGIGLQRMVDNGEMANAKGALALMIILFPPGTLLVFLAGNLGGTAQ